MRKTKDEKSSFIVHRGVLKRGDKIIIPSSVPEGLYDVVALRRHRRKGERAHIDIDANTRDLIKSRAKALGTTYDRFINGLLTVGELHKDVLSMVV